MKIKRKRGEGGTYNDIINITVRKITVTHQYLCTKNRIKQNFKPGSQDFNSKSERERKTERERGDKPLPIVQSIKRQRTVIYTCMKVCLNTSVWLHQRHNQASNRLKIGF